MPCSHVSGAKWLHPSLFLTGGLSCGSTNQTCMSVHACAHGPVQIIDPSASGRRFSSPRRITPATTSLVSLLARVATRRNACSRRPTQRLQFGAEVCPKLCNHVGAAPTCMPYLATHISACCVQPATHCAIGAQPTSLASLVSLLLSRPAQPQHPSCT